MTAPTRERLPANVRAIAAVSLLTDLATEMVYPLLPIFITTVLGGSPASVGVIEGAAESTASLLKLVSGWWSDRVRRKPLVVAGYTLASLVRPLMALTTATWQVLLVRVTDRVGKGIRAAPRDALLADSVSPAQRGRAYGVHRAADNIGAFIGPMIAFVLLGAGMPMRELFWVAAIPGLASVIVVMVFVKEARHEGPALVREPRPLLSRIRSAPFNRYLMVLLLFTLGGSSDAFLLLRARDLGVSVALLPVLWAVFSLVKSVASIPSGEWSDRVGRKPLIVAGWLIYAAVYLLLGVATATWQVWALFLVYGLHFGMTEGVEKALVADLVLPQERGAAFGWYHFMIGLGTLPASILFGWVWARYGVQTAFTMGALIALTAAVALVIAVPTGLTPARPASRAPDAPAPRR